MLNAYRRYIISLFIYYFNVDLIDREAIFMQNQIFANARKRRKEKKNVLFRKWGFTLFLMKLYIAFCIVSRLHDILA